MISACAAAPIRRNAFSREIEQRKLAILNLGVAGNEPTIAFYRSLKDAGLSSFDAELGTVGGRKEEMQIPCPTLSAILADHCIPHYRENRY